MSVKIPKKIMQTWKTKDTVPDHWKPSQEAIAKHMSDWEYTLMGDDDNRKFCQDFFPDFLSYYDAFEYPIMRADAIRYMYLYKVGGLYLDLDIQITKPLDDLFFKDRDIYIVKSGNFSTFYTNAFMASKPGVKFWLTCMSEMIKPYKFWQVGRHLKVMGTTGPLMFTRALKILRQGYIVSNGMKVRDHITYKDLPAKLLTSCSVCDAKPCTIMDANAYARTLEGSSWIGKDTEFYIYCTCNWKTIVAMIIIFIIIFIILIRYRREIKRNRKVDN